MNKNCLISVVLPVYNVELYIKEAINSIICQTVQDFEIIVIDDGSTDKTLSIIDSYEDSRIRIIKKPINKGLIDSLNIGFKEAQGKYIARMDGDDISLPNRFEKQLHILENNNEIDICGCWLQQFGKTDEILKHREFHEEIVAKMLLNCSMSMGSVMMDRKVIMDYEFDITKRHVEDYDFWSRIVWSYKLYNIQEVLYMYRIHNTQVSDTYKQIQVEADISIKLFLFKKLNYRTNLFKDDMITRMLLLNEPITLRDLRLFLKWIKSLIQLNKKSKIYHHNEFEDVLNKIRKKLLFSLYFKKTSINITKKWRFKALTLLSLSDVLFILNIKRSEIGKLVLKA